MRSLIIIISILAIFGMVEAGSQIDPERIIFHVRGTEDSYNLGYWMWPVGDINRDGYDDIALGRGIPYGVFVFYGGNPADTTPDAFFEDCIDLQCLADFTGDGINDGVSYIPGEVKTYGLYFYRGYADSLATAPFDSLVPDTFVNDVWSGDANQFGLIDDDNYSDVVIYEDLVVGRFLRFYSGYIYLDREFDWSYELPSSHRINMIAIADFNGDGYQDIFYGMRGYVWGHEGYIGVFLGPNFGSEPDVIINPPEEYDISRKYFPGTLKNIGDFNGDGFEDIGIGLSMMDPEKVIYFCGPESDTIIDLKMGVNVYRIASAGDINNDGYNDLIYDGSKKDQIMANICFGGPHVDSIPDDVVYFQDLPPEYSAYSGKTVSAAGDFNGDGIDDFMFQCTNYPDYMTGDIFVVAGSEDIMSDVDENEINILPSTLTLSQNYPNPFNPETIIEFSIPQRSHTELIIYNILGEVVAIPINKTLPAGIHKIVWDGTDSSGKQLPSGIYFYSVKSDNHSETKKMVLLK